MKTHLDLFSGIGGFAIAAQACGYTTIGFCEKEKYAQQILKERFGAVLANAKDRQQSKQSKGDHGRASESYQQVRPIIGTSGRSGDGDSSERSEQHRRITKAAPRIHDDIFTLNGADYAGVDLLTGGFPCQPFSVAGKRLGKADDRAIWPEMLRVIREAKPAWIIGENVAGIVTMELDNILSDLEALGYSAWPLVIPACAVDARHRRDRVWIIARRDVEDAASERSGGASGNALHEGREASQTGGASIPQAARRKNGSAIGDNRAAGEDVAHAERTGRQGPGQPFNAEHSAEETNREATEPFNGCVACEWLPEPELGRVAHGIPHRAHRLRGLGNAIVPQVAEEIIRAIATIEE